MMPVGVHGRGAGRPRTSQPRFVGCRPSTSFSGSTAARIRLSSSPVGCWTRNAVHAGSALSSATTASTSACVLPAGRSRRMLLTPISAQSLCLALTYQRLAGSSPTRTVPSPGTMPRAARAPTRARSSSLIAASVALPSRIVAFTFRHPARPRCADSADHHAEGLRERHALVAVHAGALQARLPGVEALEQRALQIGVLEAGVLQPDVAQVGADERGVTKVGLREVRAVHPRLGEVDARE